MPVWLTILLGVLGGTGLIGLIVKDIYSWVKGSTKKAVERTKLQKQEEMREVIQQELAPLEERMRKIEENTKKSLEADILVLRCNIKIIRDRAKRAKVLDVGDKLTADQLYERYKDLGGNEFKTCVDRWMKTIRDCPEDSDE